MNNNYFIGDLAPLRNPHYHRQCTCSKTMGEATLIQQCNII